MRSGTRDRVRAGHLQRYASCSALERRRACRLSRRRNGVDRAHCLMRLELDGITAGYGDTTVLREVSLTLPAGKVVALLGPNGAGKSTTLAVASGLLTPRLGQVLLDRRPVTGAAPSELVEAGLCHVPESG